MTNTANTPSDFWVVRYTQHKNVKTTVVYGETSDEAILAANKELNREGGYGMRRLTFMQLADHLARIVG